MTSTGTGMIESRKDFKDNPRGQYDYWDEELNASKTSRKDWHKLGEQINKRYLDSRRNSMTARDSSGGSQVKLNLFHSNVTTLTSMLYGNVPQVDVSRRYADSNDDVSRVAAEIMERLLNNDIADNGEEINAVLRSTLQDRLLPGLGCARVRYEVETEAVEVEIQVPSKDPMKMPETKTVTEERVTFEDAPIDYFYWKDTLWGWGRNWSELPWIAYRIWMNKDEVTARFGKEIADELTYKKQLVSGGDSMAEDPDQASVWSKAQVWEIWDKVNRKVVFVSQGYNKVLDTKDDPLGLSGFFPSPPFFLANPTTTLYAPTPDYHLAQDLYDEVDRLQTRITIITEAVKVVGVYDASAEGIERMFKEGVDNTLIPITNWALFGEKGGVAGQIDWVPVADIVNSLDKLRELRNETIDLLHQVTGMADVMRGGGGQYEGTGQAQIKAKMGSIRIQALQDEFAVFCSNLMQLKAEIVSLHFSPETIVSRSNINMSFDAELAPKAVELIKNVKQARLKVEIRPESVAMVDYAQLKMERTDYINALSMFMQSAAPMIEQDPSSKPFLLQLLQWGLAGFKGSSEIESVIDKAIEAAQQADKQQDGKPDPAMQQMQMQQQMEQQKQQGELSKIQAKAAADIEVRKVDMQMDIQTQMAAHEGKLAEIDADMRGAIAETQAKMEADLLIEQAQTASNIAQTQAGAEAEITKDTVSTQLELQKETVKTRLKIEEITVGASAKIAEENAKPRPITKEKSE